MILMKKIDLGRAFFHDSKHTAPSPHEDPAGGAPPPGSGLQEDSAGDIEEQSLYGARRGLRKFFAKKQEN